MVNLFFGAILRFAPWVDWRECDVFLEDRLQHARPEVFREESWIVKVEGSTTTSNRII